MTDDYCNKVCSFEKTPGLFDCVDIEPSRFFCKLNQDNDLQKQEQELIKLQPEYKNKSLCGWNFYVNHNFIENTNNDNICTCFQIVFCMVTSTVGKNTPHWEIRIPLSQHTAENMDYKIINPDELKWVTAEKIMTVRGVKYAHHYFSINLFFRSDWMRYTLAIMMNKIKRSMYPLLESEQTIPTDTDDMDISKGIDLTYDTDDIEDTGEDTDKDSAFNDLLNKYCNHPKAGIILKLYKSYKDEDIRSTMTEDQLSLARNLPLIIRSIKRAYKYIDKINVVDLSTGEYIANVRRDYIDAAKTSLDRQQAKQLKEILKAIGATKEDAIKYNITYEDLEITNLTDLDNIVDEGHDLKSYFYRMFKKIAKEVHKPKSAFDSYNIEYEDLCKIGIYSVRQIRQQNLTFEDIINKIEQYRHPTKK